MSLLWIVNFLAHLYLSGNNPKIMVGNFIGDFVKGRHVYEQYEYEIALGVELHRAIDEFTDRHPSFKASKARLQPRHGHYAGVVADIFYDHFLARQWNDYHPQLLPDFAEEVYRLMEHHQAILPQRVKYMLPFMTKGNWLANYVRLDGIDRALRGMARRTAHASNMEYAIEELSSSYELFLEEFNRFFPDARQHVQHWLQKRNFGLH
jgi:acyl carrier protein phosphodiesterase